MELNRAYSCVNFKDGSGEFIYTVKLTDRIKYEPDTGYLYCYDAVAGNVGVQIYKGYELGFSDGNSIVKVHRVKEHIFAEDSLVTLNGKPITITHPKEMVDSENFREYGMGTVLKVNHNDEDILVDLVIHDKQLVDKIAPEDEDGERHISDEFRDLSLGYTARLLPYKDTADYVQTEIKYNHLAVVKEGRASHAIIRDSKETEVKEKKPMKIFEWLKGKKVKIVDDHSVEVIDDENPERIVRVSEYSSKEEFVDPYEHDKVIKVERTTTEVVKEDDGPDAEVKDPEEGKEKEKEMKDKAYFDKAFKDAMILPEGPFKQDRINELNAEYLEAFPRQVADSKPQVSVTDKIVVVDTAGDQTPQPKTVDYAYLEKESKDYYRKLTDPEFWDSHEEWQKNYNAQIRSGRTNLNL